MISKITISGEVASGKTTVGRELAEQLNYDFISLGEIIRERAALESLSIVDFQKKCQVTCEMDKEIDRAFASRCNAGANLIIDYRMGFLFVSDAYHVFLKISEEFAIERLKIANRKNETYQTVRERNNSFKNQFLSAYNTDYTASSNFDLVINIDQTITVKQIVQTIINQVNIKNNEKQNHTNTEPG